MRPRFAGADFTFPLLSHEHSLDLISLLGFNVGSSHTVFCAFTAMPAEKTGSCRFPVKAAAFVRHVAGAVRPAAF